MKVLQLTTTSRSFFENQVTALERQGVDCTVLEVPGDFELDARRTPSDYARFLPEVLGHSLDGYDVVHANWGLLAPFALVQPTRPVVLTLWGSDVMSDRRWLTQISRLGARLADATVLPSRTMAAAVPTDNEILPFGIDTERFRPIARDEARERVGWDRDGNFVLFPYKRNQPEKNFERARRIVDQADVDAELKQVSGVDYEEMPYYLNASDALLVTSYRESGPMVVKEAAACNVPVVSVDVGFVRRTLADVESSFVSDADSELMGALNAVLSTGARSNGREVLDGLGLDVMGERLVDIYRRALHDRGQSASVTPSRSVTR